MISDSIKITNRLIGRDHSPFIIAEISGNHNQSLDRALEIVAAAAKTGVDAIKLQTYTADTLTIDIKKDDFLISDPKSLWNGKSLYELYQQAHTPWEWHKPIFELCNKLRLLCFSTPFDETAVEFLENLHAPAYKIASFENTHLPLIEQVAETGKPLLLSTGMATHAELEESVKTARAAGCKDLILLKCTSAYPALPANSNLLTIPDMQERYGCQVGLSDHTLGIGVAIASIAMGATVIEKHFTLNRNDDGVDAKFSLEPDEMRSLVAESKKAWEALGKVQYGPSEQEIKSLIFRRSIYAVKNIAAGEPFTKDNTRVIRPGFGLPPCDYKKILGRTAKANIKRGTPLNWSLAE
jgi:N-acetylneuraminate synthase